MEAFLHVYSAHFLTLQLHAKCFPLSTSSVPTNGWRMKAIRHHASLTWVRGQRQRALIHVTALFNGDGGDVGHFEDNWDAMDASHVKALLWQALKRWSLPVAVGAFVGSVIARQTFVIVASFSSLLFMAAHTVLETQGRHLNSVSDVFSRDSLHILLHTSKLITNRVISYLPVVRMACGACVRRISMYIHRLLASTWACLRATVAHKQGFLSQQRDFLSLYNIYNETSPALESQCKSTDSIICDINACIQKVEGMIQTDKGPLHMHSDTSWSLLRDNLTSLKAMVANVPLKGERHSNDAPVTPGSTVERPVKSQKRKRKNVDVNTVQSNMVENIFSGLTIPDLKEVSVQDKSSNLDLVGKIGDNFPPHARHLTDKDAHHSMTAPASSGAALDQECGLLSSELNSKGSLTSPTGPLDVVANAPKPKYIDYWTQHDQNGSALPFGSPEHKNQGHNFSSGHQKEGSFMAGDQVTQGEHDLKAPSLHADRKNFWIEEPQLSVLIGNSEQAKVSSASLNSGNLAEQRAGGHEERHEPENSLLDSKSNALDYSMILESVDADPASLTREKTDETGSQKCDSSKSESMEKRHNEFENGWSPSRFVKEQKTTQHVINGTNQTNNAVEPNIALLGSTKELAFVRENPDMHALTGFSRRINDEEFQRLMNEGEIAFSNGKAGLLGKIEVGEAETMLYEAADLFASAAALDSSSVEALGFWGNTLLVHGELKLMLSRQLRYMISTPDVISSYQIRRSRINETHDNGTQAALQQTFQAVCEQCEDLLLQAGRKYRMALSISKSEIRALYNWGLALCFRAQLIAEEGGQSACEAADKVYLAGIDKFEAIMGISRRYAPGAMLNWGLILRDRSRLRPMNSVERIDLLLQAKQLFQDALRLQPDDAQIQRALITCSVELKELQERKELQSKRSTRSFGNW